MQLDAIHCELNLKHFLVLPTTLKDQKSAKRCDMGKMRKVQLYKSVFSVCVSAHLT